MFDIIIPIFNEGDQVIKLLNLFEKNKKDFNVFLCYDSDEDDIFSYKNNYIIINFQFI